MNIPIVSVIVFGVVILIIELCAFAYRNLLHPTRGKIRKRLKDRVAAESYAGYGAGPADILKKTRRLSNLALFDRILSHLPGTRRLDLLIQQARGGQPLDIYLFMSGLLALGGFLIVSVMLRSPFFAVLAAAFCAFLPFLNLRLKKKKRMQKFERQLPEALELIARSLRAGHAFTSGFKMASEEFEDPLGPEFKASLNEINFGVSVSEALKHLADRVDCEDLKYFVVSVILQRETGGNLAEIMDSIAHIIRERFKFKDKVRVLSAEGKLSAVILVAIPFLVVIALRFVNPDYISVLVTETTGRVIAGAAAVMMIAGIFVMKRMVDIRV